MSCNSCSTGKADAGAAMGAIATIILLAALSLSMHLALTRQPFTSKLRRTYNLVHVCLGGAAIIFSLAAAAALSSDCFDCLGRYAFNIGYGASVAVLGPFIGAAVLAPALVLFIQDRRGGAHVKDAEAPCAPVVPASGQRAAPAHPVADPAGAYAFPPPPPPRMH
jgi:hypothetical protein